MKNKNFYLEHDYFINVKFNDVDILCMMWHGNYVKYMEDARCALLSTINYAHDEMSKSRIMWPVVKLNIKYIKAIEMGSIIRINTRLVEYENSIDVDYSFFDKDNILLSKGHTCQIAVNMDSKKTLLVSPEILINRVLKKIKENTQNEKP